MAGPRIVSLEPDEELDSYTSTPESRARAAALAQMAGGGDDAETVAARDPEVQGWIDDDARHALDQATAPERIAPLSGATASALSQMAQAAPSPRPPSAFAVSSAAPYPVPGAPIPGLPIAPPQAAQPTPRPDMTFSLDDPDVIAAQPTPRPDMTFSLDDPDVIAAQTPVEEPTRDHLGRPDPTSGSVHGPDYPGEDYSGPVTDYSAAPSAPAAETPRVAETPASRTMSMLSEARRLGSPRGEGRFSMTQAPLDGKPPVDAAREAAAGPLPRLDAGLPTEEEIASHRDNPLMRVLHSLQNGLRGAIGQTPRDFEHQADELAAERRAGLRTAVAGKGQTRRADAAAAATEARQAQTDALAQDRLGLEERRVAALEAQVPSQIAQRTASTEHTQATTEDVRADTAFESATRVQLDDPRSGAANAERAAIAARMELMNPSVRAETQAAIAAEGNLDEMDANELHRIRESLQAGVSLRGAGRGGGGSAAREMGEQSLVDQYVARGIAESREDAASQIAAIRAGGGNPATLLQGTIGEQVVAPPSPATQALMRSAMTTLDEMEREVARYPGDIPGIGPVEAHFPDSVLSLANPDGYHIRSLRTELADNILRIESGAAVPDSEVLRMAQRMPDMSEREFRASLPRIRRRLSEMQRTSRGARTAPAREPEGAAPQAALPETFSTPFRVVLPDGRRFTVGSARGLEMARGAGAVPAP